MDPYIQIDVGRVVNAHIQFRVFHSQIHFTCAGECFNDNKKWTRARTYTILDNKSKNRIQIIHNDDIGKERRGSRAPVLFVQGIKKQLGESLSAFV